jgi:hypothetical protein
MTANALDPVTGREARTPMLNRCGTCAEVHDLRWLTCFGVSAGVLPRVADLLCGV